MATQSVSAAKPILSESDDYSDNSIGKPTADLAKSPQHESEYDTASDSPSDGENDYDGEEDDEEDDDLDAAEDDNETGEIILDLDRLKLEEKRKVDDDEDKRNPQYIPKKGVFYEHDDRTADEPGDEASNDVEGQDKGDQGSDVDSKTVESKDSKKPAKKSPANVDRWSHDRFDEREQAPKSRQELVSSYGYDIRNEDGPPRARRRRRYGRGPNKYTRNWEDESAYNKVISAQQQQRKPRPEDFPALGMRRSAKPMRGLRDEKENNYAADDREHGYGRSQNTERYRNGDRRGRGNNRPGKMEFKNQNRSKANDMVHSVSSSSSPTARRRNDRPEMSRNSADRKANDYEQFNNMPELGYSQRQHNVQQSSQHQPHTPSVQPIHQQQVQHQMQMPVINHHHQQSQQQQHSPAQMQQQPQLQQQQPQLNMLPTVQMGQSIPTTQPAKKYSSLRQRTAGDSPSAPIQQLPTYAHEQQQQQLNQSQPPSLIVANNMVSPNMAPTAEMANTYAPSQPMPIQLAADYTAALSKPPSIIQSGGKIYYAQAQPEYVAAPVPTSQPAPPFPPAAYPQPAPQPTQQTTGPSVNAPPPYIQAAAPPPTPGAQPILNYVPGITPAPPQFPMQYSGYQNYSNVHGITYYAPQQPPARNVIPTRRPTNAIPILAPPDRDGNKSRSIHGDLESGDGDNKQQQSSNAAPSGSADDIDHILDNMFVKRAPYQPPTVAMNIKKSESDEAVVSNVSENDNDNTMEQSKVVNEVPLPLQTAEDLNSKQNAVEISAGALTLDFVSPLSSVSAVSSITSPAQPDSAN